MAIFRRGVPRGALKKIREFLWPSMGWARTVDYYYHRIFRTGDSTYKIAAGLAVGAAVSFTPFLGTHIVQAVFFAWLLRASLIAGAVGTLLGNPWTFPFIFYVIYHVGTWICGIFGLGDFIVLPGEAAFSHFVDEPLAFARYLFDHPLKLLLPLGIGGYLCALLVWPLAYFMLYYPVRGARRAYRLQRLRLQRLRKKMRLKR